MLALLSSLIVGVIFHGGTGGQELVIDSEVFWAVGMFQVVDDPEIPCIDADDLLPGGTARFGKPLLCLVSLSFLRHCSLPLVGSAGRDELIFWFLES